MASEIKVDTISEKTSANGVSIDSVVHKDSAVYPSSADGGALGSASNEWSDLFLADSSVIKFGADQDTTLTHTDGTGLTLNSTNKLCFNDASQFIQGSSATVLSIGATDEIDLTATAVDLNGTLNVSGVATFQSTPVFPDGSLAVADLDIDGATDIGAAIVDADLFIVDDGAGGANRKVTASRIKTYAGGVTTLGGLTDVSMDIANFTDSLLIQTNSDGSAPGTGTLNGSAGNIGIGKNVFSALAGGSDDTCIGGEAGKALVGGSGNTFFGVNCGKAVTSGDYNILIGSAAGDNFDTEGHNLGIGKDALGATVAGGEYNVIIGNTAGDALTSADSTVAVGYNAGGAITTGGSNTYVGLNCGSNTTDGFMNVLVGSNCAGAATDTETAIGIGTDVAPATNDFSFGKSGNIVTNDFDADANWSRASDVRKKREIYDQGLGLDFINDLRTVRFQWKPSNEFPKEWRDYNEENNMDLDVIMHGFIAQEVKEALDKHATDNDKEFSGWKEGDDGMQHTSREMFVIPLIKAMQELSAQVTTLQDEIKTLKGG